MILYFIGFLLFIYLIYSLRNRNSSEKLLNCFNGPKCYPVIGNLSFVFQSYFTCLKLLCTVYKSPVRIKLWNVSAIFIYDADNFKTIFNKVLQKGPHFRYLQLAFGNGLITIDDLEKWRLRRRLLNRTIDMNEKGSHYLKLMNEETRLMSDLERVCDTGKMMNLWNSVFYQQYRSSFRSLMDLHLPNGFDSMVYKYAKLTNYAVSCAVKRIFQPWLHLNVINNIFNFLFGYDVVFRNLHDFAGNILKAKESRYDFQEFKKVPNNEKIFIDYLLDPEVRNVYNERDLKDEINTFLDAASVTISTAICYTLVMLAVHPQEQQKVYQEIKEILGEDDQVNNIEKCDQLKFLEQCLNETLRLFPPSNHLLRYTTEDIPLKDGRIIPRGINCLMSVYGLHRNPDIYEDPHKWKPERFHEAEISKRPPFSFCPFGAGPRSCLGYKYAMISINSLLAKVVKRYRFSTDLTLQDLNENIDVNMILKNRLKHSVYIHSR